ncbi:MAG: UDP-N-acetylmuramate dehydrogenase [Oscillospiraceae bacterium]|nr:UDP-N-acetylmuramate dehydrogenase [Oscillospiraceae bacterium]
MKEKLLEICERYEMELLERVPLCEHTSFRIGGTADYWIEVGSKWGLSQLLRLFASEHIPFFVIGKGSNVLAADDGFRGVILHLGPLYQNSTLEEREAAENDPHTICFGAAVPLSRAARTAEEFSLTGMEGLSGIPGSIGGALYMNAGAYGYEMRDIVTACEYMTYDGQVHTADADALGLSYRHSRFMEEPSVILSVTVRLEGGDKAEITAKMQDFLRRRSEKQPLNYPSAGSTFKRPEGSFASKLIDECGLKGLTVGGAQVSEKHAGFVVNRFDATCEDVLMLCRRVREKVRQDTGYVLELEPVLLGNTGWERE